MKNNKDEKFFSDEGKRLLILALQDLGAIYEDKEKGSEIKNIDLTFLNTLNEDNPKVQTIKKMIELKKKEIDDYNQNSKNVHQDSIIMNSIISRLIEVASEKDLARIISKFDKNILLGQYPLPEEDRTVLTEMYNNSSEHHGE